MSFSMYAEMCTISDDKVGLLVATRTWQKSYERLPTPGWAWRALQYTAQPQTAHVEQTCIKSVYQALAYRPEREHGFGGARPSPLSNLVQTIAFLSGYEDRRCNPHKADEAVVVVYLHLVVRRQCNSPRRSGIS